MTAVYKVMKEMVKVDWDDVCVCVCVCVEQKWDNKLRKTSIDASRISRHTVFPYRCIDTLSDHKEEIYKAKNIHGFNTKLDNSEIWRQDPTSVAHIL